MMLGWIFAVENVRVKTLRRLIFQMSMYQIFEG